MPKHSRLIFLSSVLLFVLLISLTWPMSASADDGAPPPPATEEPVLPPMEETAPPSLDTPPPSATEEQTLETVEVAPPVEEGTEPSEEEGTVAALLEAMPEGSEVVVVDESGQALPLVSTEAAAIVATVDPIWCPNGQNPGNDLDDGIKNCSNPFVTPQQLIDNMDAVNPRLGGRQLYEQPGTIYFTVDPGGEFVLIPGGLDNVDPALYEADYDALKRYSLTLQGGWNGGSGAGYALTGGQSYFTNDRIQIGTSANPWGGNITINNITISSDPSSTEDVGLIVYTNGQILLDHVEVLDNQNGDGAYLQNDSGSLARNVVVRYSSFNGNAGTGLRAISNGLVRLADVTANENTMAGASLTSINGDVSVTGGSTFNTNRENGLSVDAYGDITLLNVVARDNYGDGAYLNNTFGDGTISVTTGRFIHNRENGLEATSFSDITLFNVFANRNFTYGAHLDNSFGSGNVKVSLSTFGNTAGTGNGESGLGIQSTGNVTLQNVIANSNAYAGVEVAIAPFSNSELRSLSSVAATNENPGLVTLSNVTATNNALTGAWLFDMNLFGGSSGHVIQISNSSFDGNATDPAGTSSFYLPVGVQIFSAGNVKLERVSASNNPGGMGILILTSGDIFIKDSTSNGNALGGAGLISPGNATIVCSQFNGNLAFGVDGAGVDGVFTLNAVDLSGNGTDAYVGSPILMSGGCGIFVNGKKLAAALPLRIVPVGGGEQIDLQCDIYSGTKLILPNGDNVILYCPVLEDAFLTSLTLQGLSDLPGGSTFVSGMEVKVTKGGEVRPDVGPNVIVSFVIPEDKIGSNFVILHWDGSAWTELGGTVAGGYFSVETSLAGVFVLAIR